MNKATTIITTFFLAMAHFAFAQKEPMPYEWFEKQSKIISDLQYRTNGQNGRTYAKDNFTINYSDKLASWSWRHTVNGKEYLTIAEDLDFNKVIGLDFTDNIVHVTFADNSITQQIYGGKEDQLLKASSLDFYTSSNDDRAKMLSELHHIITELKIDKGLITRTDVVNQWKAYKALKPYEFYQKYPKSILAYEGKLVEEDFHRQVKFVESFGERYGVTVMNTFDKPKNEEIMETKYEINKNYYELPLKRKIEKSNNFVSNVVYSSGLILYKYTILMDKDYNLAKQKYNEIAKELTESLDNGLIREGIKENNMEFFFYLTTPNTPLPIEKANKKKIGRIRVELKEETYKRNKWYEVYVHFYSCNGC